MALALKGVDVALSPVAPPSLVAPSLVVVDWDGSVSRPLGWLVGWWFERAG